MRRKIIFATNEESRAIYDRSGNLIYAQSRGGDETFLLQALANYLDFDIVTTNMPPTDGEYPKKITDPSETKN
jgi:hypothetical protein